MRLACSTKHFVYCLLVFSLNFPTNVELQSSDERQAGKEEKNELVKESRPFIIVGSVALLICLALLMGVSVCRRIRKSKKCRAVGRHFRCTNRNQFTRFVTWSVRCHSRSGSRHNSSSSGVSTLLTKLNTIPPKADPRYTTSDLIDHHGGQVILNNTGIKLIIPEGALPEGKTEAIHVSLLKNEKDFPHLEEGQSLLCPVVMCGPNGMQFRKPVLLVLPHCIAIRDGSCKFQVLRSDNAEDEDTCWAEIFSSEKEPSADCFCSLDETGFTLFVSHFTNFTVVGECDQKLFNLEAYHSSDLKSSEDFKIRIYCIPDFQKSSKQVEEQEEKFNGTLCDARKPMIFNKNGGKLVADITTISHGWRIVNGERKMIDFSVIWNCSMNAPSLTFILEQVDPHPRKLRCIFAIFQQGVQSSTPLEIAVSLVLPLMKQVPSSPTTSFLANRSSSGFIASGDLENTKVGFLPTELITSLAMLLDVPIHGTDYFRILAEKLNMEPQFGNWLRKGANVLSPTEFLLIKWENAIDNGNPVDHLRHLESILKEMGREDAAEKVKEHCHDVFLNRNRETVV